MHFQHIYGCHSVLMLAIFANSCSVDPTTWWLFYWSRVCAALSRKPSLAINSSYPVGASCAVFPRLLGSGPRTENLSVPEMFHASRDPSCVSGGSWSGRGSMNPCLGSLAAKLIGCSTSLFVQASSPFSPFFDGWCTSRTSLGCRRSVGESLFDRNYHDSKWRSYAFEETWKPRFFDTSCLPDTLVGSPPSRQAPRNRHTRFISGA